MLEKIDFDSFINLISRLLYYNDNVFESGLESTNSLNMLFFMSTVPSHIWRLTLWPYRTSLMLLSSNLEYEVLLPLRVKLFPVKC